MNIRNYEFKARVNDLKKYEEKLLLLHPSLHGTDHQKDTYFNVPKGRLKLREGNIENALINYERVDTANTKLSNIILYKHQPDAALKAILTLQFGIKAVVDKKRKIYFIENVKFHFDEVANLGTFVEVEAIDVNNTYSLAALQQQCEHYFHFFELTKAHLIANSYCDLLKAEGYLPLNNID